MNNLVSAGLVMYKKDEGELKVFLVHPGGPFFKNKDDGYWSIPKGLVENDEDVLKTAIREFKEETGIEPIGEFDSLGWVKQKSGKTIYAWSFEYFGNNDIKILSNEFELEWPPNSGQKQFIPEVDEGRFFSIKEARLKIRGAQAEFLDTIQKNFKEK